MSNRLLATTIAVAVAVTIGPTTAYATYATGALIRNEANTGTLWEVGGNHTWADIWGYANDANGVAHYFDVVEDWGWKMGVGDQQDYYDCYKTGSVTACSSFYLTWNRYVTAGPNSSGYLQDIYTYFGHQGTYWNNKANNAFGTTSLAYAIDAVCHTSTNRGLYYMGVPWIDGSATPWIDGSAASYASFGHCGSSFGFLVNCPH